MTAQPPRSYTTLAAAIVVAGVIIAATVFVALGSSATVTKTVPEATTTTETTTMTSISTEYVTVTPPENASLPAGCVTSQQVNAPWFGTLVTNSNSPAVICVQLYEFNSTSPITLNTTRLISIQGSQPIQGGRESVNGAGNFSVVASQRQVVLGGPTNEGEGTVVAYAITAKPGASGTYSISLGGFELGSEPESCGSNGELIAGNGQPNYALIGGCITYSTTSAQGSFTIPGVGYNILSNNIYFRIISVTNSTR